MKLRTALIIVFVLELIVLGGVFAGLKLIGARSELFATAYVFILCGGSLAISLVVMRYGSDTRR